MGSLLQLLANKKSDEQKNDRQDEVYLQWNVVDTPIFSQVEPPKECDEYIEYL
jgi:hypothetical protein